MAAVKGRNTTPEIKVRQLVHRLGRRFRLHGKDLPGRPDLVFPRLRKVIYVHGCFWHHHASCSKASVPKSRTEFWRAKFAANRLRDERDQQLIEGLGWRFLIVWQCELASPDRLKERLATFLEVADAEQ